MTDVWVFVAANIQRTDPTGSDSPGPIAIQDSVGGSQEKTFSADKAAADELVSWASRLVAATASEQRFQPGKKRNRWTRCSVLSDPITRLMRVSPLKTYLTGCS